MNPYASMADEYNFRVLDARRKVEVIQDELRRQIGAFLADSDSAGRQAADALQSLHPFSSFSVVPCGRLAGIP